MEGLRLMITNYEKKQTEEKAEKIRREVIKKDQGDSFVNGFLNLI